jgi:hypothetical protein
MKNKIVAIHQPNFFPWLGFFDKIIKSDIFIVMNNVQFPKRASGVWINRVKLLVAGDVKWVTATLNRSYRGTKLINDMEFNSHDKWREKLKKTIDRNYAKAPCYKEVAPLIYNLINYPSNNILEYNLNAIKKICNLLDIDTAHIILGSDLDVKGSATELLINMTKAVGGTAYLCGGGADGYQEDHKFKESAIELIYQDFTHPIYDQFNNKNKFVHGLSIIDFLMNSNCERLTI